MIGKCLIGGANVEIVMKNGCSEGERLNDNTKNINGICSCVDYYAMYYVCHDKRVIE